MKYKNPLTVLVVVAAVSAVGGLWSFVHGQSRAASSSAASSFERSGAQFRQTDQRQAGRRQAIYISGMPGSAPRTEDAELNELSEAEAELAREADELISQYAASDDAAEQKKVRANLRETLAKQFDLQKQRRELELSRIEERIKKVREQLKKRNDARETIVDRRLEQLVDDAEGLGWGPADGENQSGRQRKYYPSATP